jgi:hypothetical protein
MTLMLDRQYMPLGQLFNIMDPDVPDAMTQFSLEPADLSRLDAVEHVLGALEPKAA